MPLTERDFQPAWRVWAWSSKVREHLTSCLWSNDKFLFHCPLYFLLFFFHSSTLYSYYIDLSVLYLFWNQMPPSFILSLPFEYLVASESWNMLIAFWSVHLLNFFHLYETGFSLFCCHSFTGNKLSLLLLWMNEKVHWHFDTLKKQKDSILMIFFLNSPAILNIRTICFSDDSAVAECL